MRAMRSGPSVPLLAALLGLTLWLCAWISAPGIKPPVATVVPKASMLHGEVRVDDYFWLRERANPEVIAYLEAENHYTAAMMKHTETLQERLYREMRERMQETDRSAPVKIDDYYYYTRTEAGQQYPIHCRKRGSLEAAEQILLDENTLALGYPYFAIGVFRVSPNHRFLAYSTDTSGAETYTLFVKDLHTGTLLKDQLSQTYYGVEWANDNQTIFYTVLDDAKRPYKLYRHTLGTDQQADVLVYHEADALFRLHLARTKSRSYLLMQVRSLTTSEVHYLPADRPTEPWQVIEPRQDARRYDVEHHGDRWFILTNEQANNFKLMQVAVHQPARPYWQEVLPHREAVKIDGMEVFAGHLVLYERANGLQQTRITNLTTRAVHYVELPEPVYTTWRGENAEFQSHLLRFAYSSLVTPRSVFDYDMEAKTRILQKQDEVRGGYDPSRYHSERLFAPAADGTLIPLSVVYRKDVVKDGSHPLLLVGYGAYGASLPAAFAAERLSLLERGFVYAVAHVRGGGEMGRAWYEAGKLLNKQNTFHDFIASATYLIAARYTRPDRLVIAGESAGGLLMGAATNLRPDLFQAVIARVPFVDVINTMLDPSLPLVVIEYDEWGNPGDKGHYDYMKAYSPYDNVAVKGYPHMLITAGLHDPRVPYWEAAKWTAKLRAVKTDTHILLLKTNMDAGHGGPSGRYDALRDLAFEYAFLFEVLGIRE